MACCKTGSSDRRPLPCCSGADMERRITWRGIFLPAGAAAPGPFDPTWFEGPADPRFRGARRADRAFDVREAEVDAEAACFLARIAGAGPVVYLDVGDSDAMTI